MCCYCCAFKVYKGTLNICIIAYNHGNIKEKSGCIDATKLEAMKRLEKEETIAGAEDCWWLWHQADRSRRYGNSKSSIRHQSRWRYQTFYIILVCLIIYVSYYSTTFLPGHLITLPYHPIWWEPAFMWDKQDSAKHSCKKFKSKVVKKLTSVPNILTISQIKTA